MGHSTHTGFNPVKVFMLFRHFGGKTRSFDIAELLIPNNNNNNNYIAEPRLLGLGSQFFTFDKRSHILSYLNFLSSMHFVSHA